MTYILRPIAISLNVSSHKSVQRFKEQGWYLIYYTTSFIYGFYLYYNSDYFLNNDYIYINWPNDEMNHLFKAYYLIEMACWLQQIFVLNIEAKRKDYSQMFSHHIITCLLVSGSYYYYFTKIGNVIMVMMDVVDIILSLAKVLKYCGFRTVCDVLFEIFLVTWVVLRHGVYNYLLYHCVTKSRGLMESGRCAPGVSQKRCFTDPIMNVFIMLLAGLQCIMIIWMYLIAKVAIKVVSGAGADDVRSDDEED
jgi:acyl-CoA-dependent ceramide synthase